MGTSSRSGTTGGAWGGGSGMPMAPATVALPGRQRRKSSGSSLPAIVGMQTAWPSRWAAAARGSASNSSFTGR